MRYAFVEVLNIHNTMNLNNIQIRETATSDFSHIMEVEKLAFGYDKEAELVAELLADNTTKPIVVQFLYMLIRRLIISLVFHLV